MTILDMEPYILGNKHIEDETSPVRATSDDFQTWVDAVNVREGAKELMSVIETPKQFFELEPDIAHIVKRNYREEMFFSVKNGFFSTCVPAKCIYMINKLYSKYKLCSLIPKMLPRYVFGKNYIAGGFTLHDTIATLCDKRYYPLAQHRLSLNFGDYREVYIESTDMVAAIPSVIASGFSEDEIRAIEADEYGLKIHDVYIGFMGGYNGACNSIYDLRKLV
jgi:hypothetical protein